MTVSLWLFDFDNTLAGLETEVDWAASRLELEPMLRNAGAPKPLFEQFPKGNLPLYEAYRAHLAAMVRRDGGEHAAILREASAIIEKYELRGVDHAAPLDGALEMIHALAGAKDQVGIVTSNSSHTVERWLGQHQAADCVQIIVGRDSLLALKPAPDMILQALKVARVKPGEAIYVGDSPKDCAAARAAGVAFRGIARSHEIRDQLLAAGAGEIYSSPAALAIHLNLDARPVPSN